MKVVFRFQIFKLAAGNVTVTAGNPGVSTVTITPQNGYTGTVAWTVSSSPALTNGCFSITNTTVSGTTAVAASPTVNTIASACPTRALVEQELTRAPSLTAPRIFTGRTRLRSWRSRQTRIAWLWLGCFSRRFSGSSLPQACHSRNTVRSHRGWSGSFGLYRCGLLHAAAKLPHGGKGHLYNNHCRNRYHDAIYYSIDLSDSYHRLVARESWSLVSSEVSSDPHAACSVIVASSLCTTPGSNSSGSPSLQRGYQSSRAASAKSSGGAEIC